MLSRPNNARYSLRARLRDAEFKSDFVLLANNCHFIPKKLLRDAIRDAFVDQGGDRIIDVGCGFQPYRRFLQGYRNYVGIDRDGSRKPDMVSMVQVLPLASSSAEAVLCAEVLEHTDDPGGVTREIVRLLKPGGLLVLTAPMSWNLHYEPYDYFRFTRYGLQKLITDAGCQVIHVRRLGGLFALIGSRLTDVVYRKMANLLRPIPIVRHMAPMMIVIPINVFFYSLSLVADNLDHTDAIGWMVLAVKRNDQ